jgi:hypothetical protein
MKKSVFNNSQKIETVKKHFETVRDKMDDMLNSSPETIHQYYWSIIENLDYLSSVLECSSESLYQISNNINYIKDAFTELKNRKCQNNYIYNTTVTMAKNKWSSLTFPQSFEREPPTFKDLDAIGLK